MKTYRMFTEDYVDSYSTYRTSTGPGMGQYFPVADLNAADEKAIKKTDLDQGRKYSQCAQSSLLNQKMKLVYPSLQKKMPNNL